MLRQGLPGPFFRTISSSREAPLHSPMDKTSFIRQFIFNAGPSIVGVEFVKEDGTLRTLRFNPRDSREIKGTGKPTTNPSIIRCRDFSIARRSGEGAWRSFNCERVTKISANGQTICF